MKIEVHVGAMPETVRANSKPRKRCWCRFWSNNVQILSFRCARCGTEGIGAA